MRIGFGMIFKVRGEERERLDVVISVGKNGYFEACNVVLDSGRWVINGLAGTADAKNVSEMSGVRLSLREMREGMEWFFMNKAGGISIGKEMDRLLEKYSKEKDRELR